MKFIYTFLLVTLLAIGANAQFVVFDDDIVVPGTVIGNAAAGTVNSIVTDQAYAGTSSLQIKFAGTPISPAFWGMCLLTVPAPGVDLSAYAAGYLNFAMKTTAKGSFNIRMTDGTNKPKIFFVNGADPYGFKRDGQWHMVSIPIADMLAKTPALKLNAITDLFVWRSGSTSDADFDGTVAQDFYVDNIVVSNTPVVGAYAIFADTILVPNTPIANAGAGSVNSIVSTQAYTGTSSIQVKYDGFPPAPQNWCMLTLTNAAGVDLSAFASGYLNFAMKTTSTSSFNMRITDGTKKPKIDFKNGADPYGFKRDGQWHRVSIPIADLKAKEAALNLAKITDLFVWRSAAADGSGWDAVAPSEFYFDDISISNTSWADAVPMPVANFMFENITDLATWEKPFANGTGGKADDVIVTANPNKKGINPSVNVLKFKVNKNADPWAGMANVKDLVGSKGVSFTAENHTVSLMVYKSDTTKVLVKFEKPVGGGATVEVGVVNKKINEWELLTFDFTAAIGKTFESIVLFPNFPAARTDSSMNYIDNIVVPPYVAPIVMPVANFMFEKTTDLDTWEKPFANGTGTADDVKVVANPSAKGINPSLNVLKFKVNKNADPWAGMANVKDLVGTNGVSFTATNHTVTLMVYKSDTTKVLVKFEKPVGGGATVEVGVVNKKINEWELLTFDFTAAIGKTFESIVLFPNFPAARTDSSMNYLDNIVVPPYVEPIVMPVANFMFENNTDIDTWEKPFANGTGTADDVKVAANPSTTGINPSLNVLKFKVNKNADPWAGMSNVKDLVGTKAVSFTAENHTVSLMVYKSDTSNVLIKFEKPVGGGATVEVGVVNKKVNEWELLTFDFTSAIGKTFESIVLFPNFPAARTDSSMNYIDNIVVPPYVKPTVSVDQISNKSLKCYPNPAENILNVLNPGMTGFTISTLSGQTVESSNFKAIDSKSIELNKIRPGVYFLSVKSVNGNSTIRFIKK
jgi:hypothetical protein